VQVEGVNKRYGDRPVLDQLSFAVWRGEVFALLGPNGAGKTTTLELLEGYRTPDAGRVRVLGLDPRTQGAALKPRIGLMPQDGGIYPHIRPLEALRLFSAFYPQPEDPQALLRRMGLDESRGTRYRHLSGGQRQRLSLALALVGRPELVFLDEPTAAMDPQARRATWDLIRGLTGQGVTVLLTTHSLEEAERLASRVAIVNRGRLVALDTPAALRHGTGDPPAGSSEARGESWGAARGLRFRARAGLDTAALEAALGVPVRETEPGRYSASGPPTARQVAHLAAWLAGQDVLLTELTTADQSLEEVYLALTAESSPTPP
jgi:ABC-2 type transport system ATP-binding protein